MRTKIGVPRTHFFEGADPEVISIVEAGLGKLEGEGQDLIEMSLPQAQTGRGSAALITAVESAEAAPDEMIQGSEHLFDQKVLARLRTRDDISATDYENARQHAATIRAELLDALDDAVDFIVTPTCPLPAILVGEEPREINGTLVTPNRHLGLYTSVFGLAGLPAVSVPCGFTSDGLPIGMQIVGSPFEETRLLQLAGLVERVLKTA